MALHNKWYPAAEDTIVPWNATYAFPTEANKCEKSTPRISPKNGSVFLPGQLFRLEFPASGYINPLNTSMIFDVTLSTYSTPGTSIVRFQNNIASIFQRVTLYYGSNVIEDMRNYNCIVRALTEWTATNQTGSLDNSSIAEGIGGVVLGTSGNPNPAPGRVNVRQAYIQGQDWTTAALASKGIHGNGYGAVPNSANPIAAYGNAAPYNCTRRYQINFALGLFIQDKLIPVKYMASQLVIEVTLETAASCIFAQKGTGTGTAPTYYINNVVLLPEVLQFDSSYDMEFLKGLEGDGVPIKFSSWHTYSFSTAQSNVANLIVQEKSRSVKTIFMVQRRSPASIETDSHALLFDSNPVPTGGSIDLTVTPMTLATPAGTVYQDDTTGYIFTVTTAALAAATTLRVNLTSAVVPASGTLTLVSGTADATAAYSASAITSAGEASTLQTFQFRIADRYYPGRPVEFFNIGSQNLCNGGAEGYYELMKALQIMGDYRLSPPINSNRWAMPPATSNVKAAGTTITTGGIAGTPFNELDYTCDVAGWTNGCPIMEQQQVAGDGTGALPEGNTYCGNVGSNAFAMAINLETSNGVEISGLNAEQQSDIAINAVWSAAQSNFTYEVYVFYDAMLILRSGNDMDLIQ